MWKEDVQSVTFGYARRLNLLESVGLFGDRIGSVLYRRSIERVELRSQDASSQGTERIALDAATADVAAEEAERLGRVAEHVVVQLPFADPYIPLMHRLASTGVRVAATYVGSASQAMLAARTGAAFLFMDVDRIHAAGADAAHTISQTRRLLDTSSAECDLVAVFPAPGATLVDCALAGAHAAVVGTAALRAMAAYPFTEQSLMDGARRPTHGEKLRVTPS